MQRTQTCSAALKMQKGMSARSLNLLKSGSFTTCSSLSQPISTSGSLSSILCNEEVLQSRVHMITRSDGARATHQHAHAPQLACPPQNLCPSRSIVQIPEEPRVGRHAHLAYCRICERRGTRHGLLVLSMVRLDSVSSAAATCSSAKPRSAYALLPAMSIQDR